MVTSVALGGGLVAEASVGDSSLRFGAVIIGLLMGLYTSAELRDYLTLGVGTIALLALVQTWMSSTAATTNAELAQLNEERKKYGWSIVLHPDGGHYVLRNTGTLTARDVKLIVSGDFAQAAFLQHQGDEGPVIPSRQSKAFRASFPWTSRGTEIQVDWLPDGEGEGQVFNEVLEPRRTASPSLRRSSGRS